MNLFVIVTCFVPWCGGCSKQVQSEAIRPIQIRSNSTTRTAVWVNQPSWGCSGPLLYQDLSGTFMNSFCYVSRGRSSPHIWDSLLGRCPPYKDVPRGQSSKRRKTSLQPNYIKHWMDELYVQQSVAVNLTLIWWTEIFGLGNGWNTRQENIQCTHTHMHTWASLFFWEVWQQHFWQGPVKITSLESWEPNW